MVIDIKVKKVELLHSAKFTQISDIQAESEEDYIQLKLNVQEDL
jgi:hypothetical protein